MGIGTHTSVSLASTSDKKNLTWLTIWVNYAWQPGPLSFLLLLFHCSKSSYTFFFFKKSLLLSNLFSCFAVFSIGFSVIMICHFLWSLMYRDVFQHHDVQIELPNVLQRRKVALRTIDFSQVKPTNCDATREARAKATITRPWK